MKHFRTTIIAALAVAGVFNGAAGPANAAPSGPVWPPPPDQARVIYVRSITQPADVGIRGNALRRFANWFAGTATDDKRLVNPFGIALDESGGFCVTDTGANRVCYFDAANRRWQQWDHAGNVRFVAPVAVAKKGGVIFVADSALGEVVALDTEGRLLFEIKQGVVRPSGLAILGEQLYVSDAGCHCVAVFDLRGNRLSNFGERGTGPGEFNFPTHIAADSHGHLLVTDSLNSRVQVFDADGKYESEFGSAGDTSGHFGRPKGVAADSFGHIYVADAVFDNIQVFDLSGRLLLSLGETGTGPGEFGLPNGIAISPDNRIYVTDPGNHRVQVFQYVGQQ
jgi:DNA-binding beta-propeller fold protein YncE